MVYRKPELLDDHLADDDREFVHPVSFRSGGAPGGLQGCGGRIERIPGRTVRHVGCRPGGADQLLPGAVDRPPLVYRFAESRIGRMCLLDREKVDKAERYFDKHGIISTFVGRLVPAVRQLISIPAGLAKMKLSTFLLFTTLGAGLWNAILAAIGYYLHSVVPAGSADGPGDEIQQ